MLLDGKVSHVAANIVTVVRALEYILAVIVAVQVAISITVHIRIAFVFAALKNIYIYSNLTIVEYTPFFLSLNFSVESVF